MDNQYVSVRFKTGEELDEALQKAMECSDNAARAEAAANRAEEIAATIAALPVYQGEVEDV